MIQLATLLVYCGVYANACGKAKVACAGIRPAAPEEPDAPVLPPPAADLGPDLPGPKKRPASLLSEQYDWTKG